MTSLMIYAMCAVAGGTFMLLQFALSALGLGHGHDLHDGVEAEHSLDGHSGADHHEEHGNWLFGVLTLRTATAGITFFGLAGLAADAAHWSPQAAAGTAIVGGVAAFYGVHYLMRSLHRLRSDGTVYTSQLIGARGQVYLRISASRAARGKVHLVHQGRMLEYEAITSGGELLPNETIEVVAVAGPDTLEVQRAG